MTEKDFQVIVAILAEAACDLSADDFTQLVDTFSRNLKEQYPRFDSEKFEEAVWSYPELCWAKV